MSGFCYHFLSTLYTKRAEKSRDFTEKHTMKGVLAMDNGNIREVVFGFERMVGNIPSECDDFCDALSKLFEGVLPNNE